MTEPLALYPTKVLQLLAADLLVLGRNTYEGLARVWPDMKGDRRGAASIQITFEAARGRHAVHA